LVNSVLRFTASDYPFGILWPLCCLSFALRLLITPLVYCSHCVVCPSLFGFWLPLWYLVAIVLSVLRFTASDYPFGILLPLCCLSFALRLLIIPLVSCSPCVVCPSLYGFWLPLWYLVAIVLSVLRFTASDYPFGILWPLCCLSFALRLLITPLVSSDYPFGIFWLPLWFLLITPLVSSDYPYGIFWLPLWYSLITPTVSSDYPYGIFWLPLWYLLITPMVSSDYPMVSSDYPYGIFWLPLRYLLITPLVSSDYPFGIFWLPLRYLLITPMVSSDYPYSVFWLSLWYLQTFLTV
jgi:hypothetical protein